MLDFVVPLGYAATFLSLRLCVLFSTCVYALLIECYAPVYFFSKNKGGYSIQWHLLSNKQSRKVSGNGMRTGWSTNLIHDNDII